jgi:mono/diheme cytochrome c family protein
MHKLSLLALAAVVSVVTACSDSKPAEPTTTAPAPVAAPAPAPAPVAAAVDPAAEANAIFTTRCAACHGVDGKGDGIAAASLNPKPRAYSDQEWQKSVDDSHIAKVIVEGGPSVGKSPLMTANPDLKDKPAVVAALVAKIRSYRQ